MRFHLLGLAHTRTTRAYLSCAFTQKVHKLARMLTSLGHEVIHYGAAGADVPCESVVTVPEELFQACYGTYDWRREHFRYSADDPAMQAYLVNTTRAVNARKQPGDFLLSTFGLGQKPIFDGVDGVIKVESGIGYSGTFAPFRVFESQAWMHYIWGRYGTPGDDGLWYDAVIPNSFDPADFEIEETGADWNPGGEYYLYLGRIIPRKGIHIAAQVCERLGKRLVVAGQGRLEDAGLEHYKCIEFIGSVQDQEIKSKLLHGATALFCPTLYVEPFGGAAVEAMLCGTPVIASNFGAFTETILQGVSGFRCQNFADFCLAAEAVKSLDSARIREYAVSRYSNQVVGAMYGEYFRRLEAVFHGKGWYEEA